MSAQTLATRAVAPGARGKNILVGILCNILLMLCGYGLGLLSSTVAVHHKQIWHLSIQAAANHGVSTPSVNAPTTPLGALNTTTALIEHTRAANNGAEAHTNLPSKQQQQQQQQQQLQQQLQDQQQQHHHHPTAAEADNVTPSPCIEAPDTPVSTQQNHKALISHSELDHVGREGPAACDKGSGKGLQLSVTEALVAPIVIVGHNRVNYLAQCMMGLLKHWTKEEINQFKFPLFVSIDGEDQRALNFAAAWKDVAGVQVITRVHDPNKCTDPRRRGGCHISAHYKLLLQLFFQCLKSPRLIFLEEDLEVAPDFLSYFEATAPLLSQDPSLWCVSAWNDHGQRGRAVNSTALYRTDIIPGLGWMIDREHALPLIKIWPELYWDDWMRKPQIRQNHQCIFPEVSRTYHYGRIGTHMGNGEFFNTHLANIRLSSGEVTWTQQDLSYLLSSQYEATMDKWLAMATPYNASQLRDLRTYCDISMPPDTNYTSDLVVTYAGNSTDPKGFTGLARQLPGVSEFIAEGRPRMSYRGVVVTRCRGRRLFIRPSGQLL